ncbi:hypothetical protein G7Y89_g5970 [Cudoniella acicularis]|uniref:NAD(P)-binding domain-containing protein n=1 Tax=Cudoniella acicularis TaxID=354080 RepID=A0A8H4RNP3_9HELO|nr:hypothetical protein G7Y89_g5970 [Cudoniella acicularis]
MKLILAGTSGFIGQEVLSQCLSNPSITSLVALSRRPLTGPNASDPRLTNVILQDFMKYTPEVLSQLKGAEGCVWALGAKSTDAEVTRRVSLDYVMVAAKAFSEVSKFEGKIFRFALTSGILAVRDQKRNIWLYPEARKVGGEAESNLLDFAKENEKNFEAYIARPAGVRAKDGMNLDFILGKNYNIKVDELVASLIDVATKGSERRTWENKDLVLRGREILAKEK